MLAIFCCPGRRLVPAGWQPECQCLRLLVVARQSEDPGAAPEPCPCCYYRQADLDPVTGLPASPGWVDFGGQGNGWTWWHGTAPHGRPGVTCRPWVPPPDEPAAAPVQEHLPEGPGPAPAQEHESPDGAEEPAEEPAPAQEHEPPDGAEEPAEVLEVLEVPVREDVEPIWL